MKMRIPIIVASFLAIPLLANLAGWNLFVYLQFGKKDLIVACSQLVSHNAWAEHLERDSVPSLVEDLGLAEKTLLDVGPLRIFAENTGDPLQPLRFSVITPTEYSDYRGFEFPWMLVIGLPLLALLRRKKGEPAGADKADKSACLT